MIHLTEIFSVVTYILIWELRELLYFTDLRCALLLIPFINFYPILWCLLCKKCCHSLLVDYIATSINSHMYVLYLDFVVREKFADLLEDQCCTRDPKLNSTLSELLVPLCHGIILFTIFLIQCWQQFFLEIAL